jgi:hypothetical protein
MDSLGLVRPGKASPPPEYWAFNWEEVEVKQIMSVKQARR